MKKTCGIVFSLAALLWSFPLFAGKRVLVMTGGGFNTAEFLGMLDGVRAAGWEPDYIVTACGSSLATAIAGEYPTAQAQREFVNSETYRHILASAQIRYQPTEVATRMAGLFTLKPLEIPDVFRTYLMDIPASLLDLDFRKDFPVTGPRLVMVASRALFGESDAGQIRDPQRKLFQEVFFTDPETSRRLEGMTSPLSTATPTSAIESEVEVKTHASTIEAARASITDPYYVAPFYLDHDYYFTGAVDIYPLEVARRLGDDIVMAYGGPYSSVEEQVIRIVYGYDNNKRLGQTIRQPVSHWIDTTDVGTLYDRAGLNPEMSIFVVKNGIPNDLAQYQDRVRQQWEYGYQRGREAIQTPLNSVQHIRKPYRG
jgi:predicted acylesterase/phospholipase RssA